MPSTSQMKRLGWGNPDASDYEFNHIVTLRRHGIALRVRREVAPLFAALLDGLVSVEGGAWLTHKADDWGYANRNIRGSSTSKSYHAWGLAVDVNAADNPSQSNDGSMREDMPKNASHLAQNLGMQWGGDWTSLKDPMHFEVHGSKDAALKRIDRLTPTIRPGAEGYEVRVMQRALNAHLPKRQHVKVTGKHDKQSQAGLVRFKERARMDSRTPTCGQKCWAELGFGRY